jgi:hypothetical protein
VVRCRLLRFGYSLQRMNHRRLLASTLTLLVASAAPAAAQNTEARLKDYFEGRRVTVLLDMPANAGGVNIRPDKRRDLDTEEYRSDLRRFGTAIESGESAIITLIKVKDDLIEFQLDGGGYGTFLDDTDTSPDTPLKDKSQAEKTLERRVRDEKDKVKRAELEDDLETMREIRERENRRIQNTRDRETARKEDRIALKRLQGGSRFNIRFDGKVPRDIRPEDIVDMLTEFVTLRRRFD